MARSADPLYPARHLGDRSATPGDEGKLGSRSPVLGSVLRRLNPMNQFRIDFELRVHRVKERRFCDSLRDQQSIKRVAVMRGQCSNMGRSGRPYRQFPETALDGCR